MPAFLSLLALLLASPAMADEASHRDELTKREVVDLETALDESHRLIATYAKVLLDHDGAKPFADVLETHKAHADEIAAVLVAHGEAVPESRWAGRVRAAPTLIEACQDGLSAERDGAQRHAELAASTDRPELRAVYGGHQAIASTESSEAFARCVAKAEKKAKKGKDAPAPTAGSRS